MLELKVKCGSDTKSLDVFHQKGQMALLYYGRLAELAYGVVLLRRRPSGHEGSNPSSSAKKEEGHLFR